MMVLAVLLERDSIGHFAGCRMDPDIETEGCERFEGDGLPRSIGCLDHELMIE